MEIARSNRRNALFKDKELNIKEIKVEGYCLLGEQVTDQEKHRRDSIFHGGIINVKLSTLCYFNKIN